MPNVFRLNLYTYFFILYVIFLKVFMFYALLQLLSIPVVSYIYSRIKRLVQLKTFHLSRMMSDLQLQKLYTTVIHY